MGKKWILVIDSGIGGLYTLKKIKQKLPNENFLYYMDVLHAPYGNKSVKKLKQIADETIKKFLENYDIKLVVFACNTLGSVCFDYIKQKYFNIPFVKIEPIIDTARLNNKQTLVLATKNTIKHNEKIKQLRKYKNIYFYGFKTLAKKIDKLNGNCDELQNHLSKKLQQFKNKKISSIILGCTHFNYIKKQLKNIFGEDVIFLENSEIVAQRVFYVLKYSGLKSRQKKMGTTLILKKV